MPDPVTGILAATSIGGSLIGSSSSRSATRAQTQAADASIAEQRRQFDQLQGLLRPYVDAGGPALRGLMDLAGLSPAQTNWTAYAQSSPALMAAYQQQVPQGPIPRGGVGAPYGLGDSPGYAYSGEGDLSRVFVNGLGPVLQGRSGNGFSGSTMAYGGGGPMSLEQFAQQYYAQNGGDISQFQNNPQAQAVAQIEGQPMFQAIARQGEDAILQNASATGGLRGGNTQGALARFRPELLNQFIQQQYARLAGITELGQNAAAGVGSAGLATGANIGSVLQQQGAAQAAGAGAQGQIFGNLAGSLGGLFAGSIRPNSAGLVDSVNATRSQYPGLF